MRPATGMLALVGFLTAAASVAPAFAQMDSREAIALQNQLLELRHDLQALRDQVARGGSAAPSGGGSVLGSGRGGQPVSLAPAGNDLMPQLLDRVSALEEQVRALRGRIDEIGNQTQQQGQDFPKQLGDLNFRIQNLENGRGGGSSAVPKPALQSPPEPSSPASQPSSPASQPPSPVAPASPAKPGGPAGSQPPRRPDVAIQEGNAALARRDYAAAESAAREVLANRTSPRSYDAQLLLAQALAGRQDWPQAAIAYDDAYSRSRTGSHAQDALLGLANSLVAMGDKRAGCAAITKLRAEFPTIRPDLRESVAAVRGRAGCG